MYTIDDKIEGNKKSIGAISVTNQNQCTFCYSSFINSQSGSLSIQFCTFCNSLYDISLKNEQFTFRNNIMMNSTFQNSYFGIINCNDHISSFELHNISFLYNRCNNLYGSGAGHHLHQYHSLIANSLVIKQNKIHH